LQLRTIIKTGGDDLRGGNGPNDNCDAILTLASGGSITIQNLNDGLHWNNGETHTVVLPLPTGIGVGDITEFTLHTQFGGGISGDNWNVDQLSLVASTPAVTLGQFTPVYAQGDPGSGIGGYNLIRPADQAFAFDYDSSGKLDHLVLYRPGTGAIFILKNNEGQFIPVYEQGDPGSGIGGYDLESAADQAFAFDYDSSGKLDHLVLYRPGTGAIFIIKKQ
jgi:hypothetical protein